VVLERMLALRTKFFSKLSVPEWKREKKHSVPKSQE